ncbi:MAG: glycosyltransferase [Silvibacterium sp.]|jgi:UDP-D-galactose:(glucosyl)LPS alpha-1,6-D-galactosyltransferase
MKIAFFIPIIAGRGGVETVLVNLLRELRAEGDDPRLFIYSGSRKKEWLQQLPWVKEIGSPDQHRAVRLWTYFRQTIEELRRWKPDAIVCTHPSTLKLARFCRRILRSKNVPVVLWLHGPLSVHAGIERALPAADGHICICRERAEEVEHALSVPALHSHRPIVVAYNGTSVDRRYSLRRAATPSFVYIGRLLFEDQKRVGDIVKAAARLEGDFRLRLVGDGPEDDKQRLFQLADRSGISEKLEWLGWQSEPWSKIQSATALIIASSYEGFSMSIIESLALGLPVVCAEFPGVSEAVIPGKTGWTFPVGDVPALAAILQSIIDQQFPLPPVEDVKRSGAQFSVANMAASFRSALEMMNAEKSRIG